LDRAPPPRGAPFLSTGRAGAHPAPVAIAAAGAPSAGGSLSAAGRAGEAERIGETGGIEAASGVVLGLWFRFRLCF